MRKLSCHLIVLLIAAAMLSACAPRRPGYYQRNVFEITAASITLSAGVDAGLKDELQRRLDAAIEISHRGGPVQPAYLDIGILGINAGGGLNETQNIARVQVIARNPETNEPLYLTDFEAVSYAGTRALANIALAESIAARIRTEFALAVPTPEAIEARPKISTVLRGEDRTVARPSNARPLPARGDALLNSQTQFDSSGAIKPKPQDKPVKLYVDEETGTLTEIAPSDEGDSETADGEPCVVTVENDCSG